MIMCPAYQNFRREYELVIEDFGVVSVRDLPFFTNH